MKAISYLEFYQNKHNLKPGAYLVKEHDDTEIIAVIQDCDCVCVKWFTLEEFNKNHYL